MAVHERSTLDPYPARRLHDLLAGWPPRRRSPQCDRQSKVTAQLNELHPKNRSLLRAGLVIRRRAA